MEGNSLCEISVCCVCLTNELNLATLKSRRRRRRMAFKIGKQWLINPEMGDIRSRSQHTISSARFFTRGDNLLHLWAHDMQNCNLSALLDTCCCFWLQQQQQRIKRQIVMSSSLPYTKWLGWLFCHLIGFLSSLPCLLPTLSRDCSSSLRLINDQTILIAK